MSIEQGNPFFEEKSHATDLMAVDDRTGRLYHVWMKVRIDRWTRCIVGVATEFQPSNFEVIGRLQRAPDAPSICESWRRYLESVDQRSALYGYARRRVKSRPPDRPEWSV
jgi:hypothetical protein